METNEQAKQEAIKKAWGLDWLKVHNKVDAKGRLDLYYMDLVSPLSFSNLYKTDFHCFPVALENIISNNGWIRIEPDGSNLPKDENNWREQERLYEACNIEEKYKFNKSLTAWEIANMFNGGHASHYKPTEKELLPVY